MRTTFSRYKQAPTMLFPLFHPHIYPLLFVLDYDAGEL